MISLMKSYSDCIFELEIVIWYHIWYHMWFNELWNHVIEIRGNACDKTIIYDIRWLMIS